MWVVLSPGSSLFGESSSRNATHSSMGYAKVSTRPKTRVLMPVSFRKALSIFFTW